jgi:hypothetical protein
MPPATNHTTKRLVVNNGLDNGVSFTFFNHAHEFYSLVKEKG